jgi:hypothetical protein
MGLDPKANRAEREREKAKAEQPPPLNPPFPYKVVPFDPWTFDLQNDPPPIDMPP